jgi:hypothetical protein
VGPISISLIVFGCVFGAALVGMFLRTILPAQHFAPESNDVIKLALALVTTMNALVLGLLISTAKSSYDTKRAQLAEMAADSILADRSLVLYGSEAKLARVALQQLVAGLADQVQHLHGNQAPPSSPDLKTGGEDFYLIVRKLVPATDEQKALKAEVLRISLEVAQVRATALAQRGSSIPMAFLVVLIFWLAILFAGFGLFAPPNATVVVSLCVCAVTVSAAVFTVVGMDEAFIGVMGISAEPLHNAMAVIGK